jgi:hypothetical protein
MDARWRRLLIAATGVAALMIMPASAAADCNGPDCGPAPVVEGPVIAMTIAIILVFFAVMAAAEVRRR